MCHVHGVSFSFVTGTARWRLEVLARTSTPVWQTYYWSYSSSLWFPQLTGCITHLEAPHIVAFVPPYDSSRGTLLGMSPLLEAFAGLRFPAFMVSMAPSEGLDDESERWGCAYPTLTCPKVVCGSLLVQIDIGWQQRAMTLLDMIIFYADLEQQVVPIESGKKMS
ncbi:hypothetical protein EDB89DRAFT_1979546 [Lactarius sanguifluus]|nr:hypothetical protein EDB89DRAFT_1979546 [Lactarius sanguifluus]